MLNQQHRRWSTMIVMMTMLSSFTWSRGICHHWFSLTDPAIMYNIMHVRLRNEFKWLYMQKERGICIVKYVYYICISSFIDGIRLGAFWVLHSVYCFFVFLSIRHSVFLSSVFGKGWMVIIGLRSSKSAFCVNNFGIHESRKFYTYL